MTAGPAAAWFHVFEHPGAAAAPPARPSGPGCSSEAEAVQFAVDFAAQYRAREAASAARRAEREQRERALARQRRTHHFEQATSVLPKSPGQERSNEQWSCQFVREAYSRGSFVGIRSLPSALDGSFRLALYEHLQSETAKRRAAPTWRCPTCELPCSEPLPAGQRQPPNTTAKETFTTYVHMNSEYDREKEVEAQRRQQAREQQSRVSLSEFAVRGAPVPPQGQGCFGQHSYDLDPYHHHQSGSGAKGSGQPAALAPLVAGGRIKPAELMRGLMRECLELLSRELSRDWPQSFVQVFLNRLGSVIASFTVEAALAEGAAQRTDVLAYMDRLAACHPTVGQFHLLKDGQDWGSICGSLVHFELRPVWVHSRPAVPAHLAGGVPVRA